MAYFFLQRPNILSFPFLESSFETFLVLYKMYIFLINIGNKTANSEARAGRKKKEKFRKRDEENRGTRKRKKDCK